MLSLQHKLVTRIILIIHEHETQQKNKCTILADSQCLRIISNSNFSNKTFCVSAAVKAPYTLENVRSQAVHAACDQYMFLDPQLFFVPCVPEAQLVCALSSPFEHSVPLWAYSQLQSRSAAIFLLHYQM